MANFKNSSDKCEVLTTIVFNEDFKKRCPIAYYLKVEELMEECELTREEAEKRLSESEVAMEVYYEKGRGFFAVESSIVECADIYSPYTKNELIDRGELNDIINLFLQQEWYDEWEKAYCKYNHLNKVSTFLYYNGENDRPDLFISGAFDWSGSDKGLDYWVERNGKWLKLLKKQKEKTNGHQSETD